MQTQFLFFHFSLCCILLHGGWPLKVFQERDIIGKSIEHYTTWINKYLPSNLLCLETNVLLKTWLVSSTRVSKSCLLCWPNLSSISWVQHVFPWEQTRRWSPAKQTKIFQLEEKIHIKCDTSFKHTGKLFFKRVWSLQDVIYSHTTVSLILAKV